MESHFSCNVVFNPAFWSTQFLCDHLDSCPESPGRGQIHTSISAIQSFRVFMIHGFPVGQLVGSSLWAANILQMVLAEWGKQRGSGEYCRWGTVGSRTFPLIKKETMTLGIPNLWMSWQITRRPLKRNTCQSGGISDQSIWTKRRLQQHHVSQWCQNFPSLDLHSLGHVGTG